MCKGKKKLKDSQHNQQSSAKYVRQEEQEETSDSDFAFQLRADKSNTLDHASVQVRINGVKGKMEADSCSTANIMDEFRETPVCTREDNSATHRYSVVRFRSNGTRSTHWLFRCRN